MKEYKLIILMILFALSLAVSAVLGFFLWQQEQNKIELLSNIEVLQKDLALVRAELATSTSELIKEKERSDSISGQVFELADTVGELSKLSNLDKELLKKYSKVYFLSEHYTPSALATITPEYLYDETSPLLIHQAVWPFLERMLGSASASGLSLKINSAYRSFGEQVLLKTGYKVVYGSGANKFSADQGYSEHQLGTTIDITTPELTPTSLSFAETDAYRWLLANAHNFGFVLSYPKGNTYYQYEPWHWRFVGVALATKLKAEEKNFYDYPQRLIDTYLVSLFD